MLIQMQCYFFLLLISLAGSKVRCRPKCKQGIRIGIANAAHRDSANQANAQIEYFKFLVDTISELQCAILALLCPIEFLSRAAVGAHNAFTSNVWNEEWRTKQLFNRIKHSYSWKSFHIYSIGNSVMKEQGTFERLHFHFSRKKRRRRKKTNKATNLNIKLNL